MIQENITIPVTIGDIYGRPLANLSTQLKPRQQFTEFRNIGMQEEGVTFLALDGRVLQHNPHSTHRFGGPRLIIKTRPNRKFVYTELDQDGVPAVGQPYLDANGMIAFGVDGMTEQFTLLQQTVQEVA